MRLFLSALALVLTVQPASAQQGFDPAGLCYQQFSQAEPVDQYLMAAYVSGFQAARTGRPIPMTPENLTQVVQNIARICSGRSNETFLQILATSGEATGPGSRTDAIAFLERFLVPNANVKRMTASLKPTPEEIARVYDEPLSSALVDTYEALYTPDAAVGPKPGQTDVLVVHTYTDMIKDGAPVVREFPGGYTDVQNYMKPGIPIVYFKFVEPGKTTGYAFDGLVFVDGRWVLMPKPWRALN